MAHLRRIVFECDQPGCIRDAREQVYTFRNDPGGRYCKLHAARALQEKERAEQEYFKQCSDAGMRP